MVTFNEGEKQELHRMNDDAKSQKGNTDRKERRFQNLLDAAQEFVDQTRIYFVAALDRYVIRQDGEWTFLTDNAMRKFYGDLFGVKGFDKAFLYVMKESGRNYRDVTHSFTNVDGKLNLLDRDNWITPASGDHHWFFDCLMTSMGGGKPENVEHIERVLAYKFEHPECVRLPALLLHGEGNIGKNLLVDSIFREVYAGATLAANSSDVVGQFNSLVAGKVIVMIDETSPRKMDHDRLKHVLQREILSINTKNLPQYETNNLGLYFLSSNRKRGGIYLDRSQADRRYSVIFIEDGKDLIHWLCLRRNWTREQAMDWMDKIGSLLVRDRTEIAYWLHHLVSKYAEQSRPKALHGTDYERLLGIQQPVEESLIPAVFGDEQFTHIDRRVFYAGYVAMCAEDGREPMAKPGLFETVRTWLRGHPEHGVGPLEEQFRRHNSHDAHVRCWYKGGCKDKAKYCNDAIYLDTSGFRPRWIGPEGR
jgi:hypothetical protein